MSVRERNWVVGVTPFEHPNADLVVALVRAGALGVLDLGRDLRLAESCLDRIEARTAGEFGVRISDASMCSRIVLPERVRVVLAPLSSRVPRGAVSVLLESNPDTELWVEVTSREEAREAISLGATALVAKGAESGGRVGESTCYVLIQQLLAMTQLPVFAQGGIGLHTAAAAVAGGAAGVVIDAQLACVRESEESEDALPAPVRAAIRSMDGSETTLLGNHRVYTRPDLPIARVREASEAEAAERLGGSDLRERWIPVGQDGAFARPLAERFKTAGGVVVAIQRQIRLNIDSARILDPIGPGSPLAREHGAQYPIAQGPMTRVSDKAEFAAAVAEAGGLPFLALALMSGSDVRQLLDETVAQLGDNPWGVGILGFVPAEVREAQLDEVRRVRPPFALIAGGRPSQARALEKDGIPTYLHVPSSGLLASFYKDGARRFVFEGRECGGHVGPRSSFALWEAQTQELLRYGDLSDVCVLFAGGIHDARSAAMVAALAGAIAERGAKVGVLMGSAYILTREAVLSGAVQSLFQEQVCAAERTVLLETSPGHAIRVLDSPYIEQFYAQKRELAAKGASVHEVWAALEELNLGRLRIATKGVRRDGGALVEVSAEQQLSDGMFMIGQIATLHDEVVAIADLHARVSRDGSRFLASETPVFESPETARPLDIAIVGLAGCFPQAEDVDTYWSNIVYGHDAISEVPPERWSIDAYYDPEATGKRAGEKSLSKWGGFLPEIPFDALDYGIPPRSLASIDPVQLLSLEMARRALSDAGYAKREFDRSRTAVIFGAESGTDLSGAYGLRSLFTQFCGEMPDDLDAQLPRLTEDSFPGVLTNVIAGRIANRLDLGGANFTVDAACATSMAAVDQSCKELRSGACDMVLCGAADLHNGIADYLLFSSVHALSRRGRCRTFDRDADGIALGEGVACIVLKRLEDAERDGDRIYAVLRGSGASSDGRSLGLTAPRPEGQRLALARAYEQAGISPSEVGLVEAHGTGTVVGDRTELAALTELYLDAGSEAASCTLGSVKSQIGHTKCTAGLAGLIKASLSLYARVRTPTANLSHPNPYYEPRTSPFHFAHSPRPWIAERRHAAVSAFGFGGSNFHSVLSAYAGADAPARGLKHWPVEIVLLCGEDREAARASVAALRSLLDRNDQLGRPWRLRDIAYTCATRSAAPVQIAALASSLDELRDQLEPMAAFRSAPNVFVREDAIDPAAAASIASPQAGSESGRGKIGFLFPGQGSQRVGMLADLFVAFPELQGFLELAPEYTDLVFPASAFAPEEQRAQQQAVTDTRVAQPALGIMGLAINALLGEFGIRPDVAAGHSYGELVALCAAGAFSPADLVTLSSERALAILEAAGADPGAMVAVQASAGEVELALEGVSDVVLANDNAPRQIVISGTTEAIDRALELLELAGFAARRLPVACAFHSPIVAGAAERLGKRLAETRVQAPEFPVWSNSNAREYPRDPDALAELLAQQVARPVRFREEIENMYADGVRIFVEAGPGRVLTGLVKKVLGERPHVTVCCDVPGEPALESVLRAVARLAVLDVPIRTQALFEGRSACQLDSALIAATRPHYRLNGFTVRDASGEVVEGALRPANALVPVVLTRTGSQSGSDDREVAVQTYLRGMRELISAQREVMLGYLGEPIEVRVVSEVAAPRERAAVAASGSPIATPGAHAFASSSEAAASALPSPDELAAPANPTLSGDALMRAVLEIVSERTGYPAEMLEPDLDLEADLSIDSIKRMEILAELAERVALPGGADGELDEAVVEELARLKTLRAVVSWIDAHGEEPRESDQAGVEDSPNSVLDTRSPSPEPVEIDSGRVVPGSTLRFRYELALAGEIAARGSRADGSRALAGRSIRILGGAEELRKALELQIEQSGGRVSECGADDPASEGEAWIHLGALSASPRYPVDRIFVDLKRGALTYATELVVATGLGGGFGLLHGLRASEVEAAAGVRGLVRTLAREFPDTHVSAVDLDPEDAPNSIAKALLAELSHGDHRVDVGCAGGVRRTLLLREEPLDVTRSDQLQLGSDAVILVTGGARGIGARAALALAERSGAHVVLCGRSALPSEPEPENYAHATGAPELRRAIIEAAGLRKPAEIEAEVARVLAAREIRANLAALEELAASVEYHRVDVRDPHALAAVLRAVYTQRGRIDGVVHAAGVLEDKLIRDKTVESFRRVFETKVSAFRTLATELRPDLAFFVSFGSVAGTFGNRGQVDYAAANEALSLYSRQLAERVGARVVTMAWGPWAGGGMVSPELEREYARRGIGLIDPEDGVQCLLDELRFGERAHVEVILMRSAPAEWTVPVTRPSQRADLH